MHAIALSISLSLEIDIAYNCTIRIAISCWHSDDVRKFEEKDAKTISDKKFCKQEEVRFPDIDDAVSNLASVKFLWPTHPAPLQVEALNVS